MLGGLSGFFSVAAGAFGAHALQERLPQDSVEAFNIGARYHLIHSVCLLAVGILLETRAREGLPTRHLGTAATLFFIGILIFSGSLYILALSGVKAWGAVTPLGGLTLLAAWLWLTRGALETASGTHVGQKASAKDTRAPERETL